MKKSSRLKRVWIILLTGLFLLSAQGMIYAADPASAAPTPKLQNEDCIKCHSKAPNDIATAGSKHKTEIGCQDCHNGHPPSTRNIIPLCSQCHEGKSHFKLDACRSCHVNPHTPLNIKLARNLTDPCLTCHTQQIAKLRDNKSKHSLLYCTTCHDTHGRIPACTQCHKAHSSDQTNADCKRCHQAHMPKNIVFADKTPSKDCAACHRKAYELLTASTFKHKNLACVACHQGKHKMVPQCQSCHGTPHPASMMARFPKCGFCHNIAHDLNSFKETAPAAVQSPAPARKKPRKQQTLN